MCLPLFIYGSRVAANPQNLFTVPLLYDNTVQYRIICQRPALVVNGSLFCGVLANRAILLCVCLIVRLDRSHGAVVGTTIVSRLWHLFFFTCYTYVLSQLRNSSLLVNLSRKLKAGKETSDCYPSLIFVRCPVCVCFSHCGVLIYQSCVVTD